jgi:hypothetical protein
VISLGARRNSGLLRPTAERGIPCVSVATAYWRMVPPCVLAVLALGGCASHGFDGSGGDTHRWAALEAGPLSAVGYGTTAFQAELPRSKGDVAVHFDMSMERPNEHVTRADWQAVAELYQGFRMTFEGSFDDQAQVAEAAQSQLGFGPVQARERNTALDATAIVESGDGRARTVTRVATSTYLAPMGGYQPKTRDGRQRDKNLQRFAGVDRASDDAFLQRLEIKAVESGPVELMVFSQYGSVGRFFESAKLQDRSDPFLNSGNETLEAGGTLGLGPLSLTLAQSAQEDLLDDHGNAAPRKGIFQRARASVSLAELTAGTPVETAWLPDSVWFSTEQGVVRPLYGAATEDDLSRTLAAGLSWSSSLIYGHLGYSRETYESANAATLDLLTDTLDAGIGVHRPAWNLYASFGLGRTEYPVGTVNAVDHNVDFSIFGGIKVPDLPDLTLAATISHYLADYPADDTAGRYSSWDLNAKLDFSKLLHDKFAKSGASLGFIYGLSGHANADGYSGSDQTIDHAIGIQVSVPLK